MEIQNLLNSLSKINIEGNSDLLSRLKTGDILKAKVLSMIADTIILEVNGKLTLEAKDMSTIHYNTGDLVEFTVTDKVGDKLFIKSNISKTALLESKLSEMGIKMDESNKELIEFLFKNQVPITKENISLILSTKNYYGKLVQLINDNDTPINPEILNSDIKEALKNLIQNSNANSTISTSQQGQESTSLHGDNKVNINFPFINEFLNNEGRVSLEKLVFMLKNNLDFNAKDIILVDNLLEGKNTITNQIENLINLLDEDITNSNGKDIMNDTNNRDVNVKDIINNTNGNIKDIINNIGNRDGNIKEIIKNIYNKSDNIKDIIDDMDNDVKDTMNSTKDMESKDIKNKLLSLLQKFNVSTMKEKSKIQLAIKELFKGLEDINNNILNNKAASAIGRHIEELKASFDFVNKLNENMAFIQVPLYLNNSRKNLDIYIKKDTKGRKKINANNAKIFISLNTNKLDLVQVLIELNQKDISLNFKVCSEGIKNIIKANENILRDSLIENNFNSVVFKYSLQSDKLNLTNMDLKGNSSKLNTLDIRV